MEIKGIGLLALLSALFWVGVPLIMLASDYQSGGVANVLNVIQSPEYEDIRVSAFYIPTIACLIFCITGLALLLKSNFSFNYSLITVVLIAFSISVYSALYGLIPSYFGLVTSSLILWKIYVYKKNTLNKAIKKDV